MSGAGDARYDRTIRDISRIMDTRLLVDKQGILTRGIK